MEMTSKSTYMVYQAMALGPFAITQSTELNHGNFWHHKGEDHERIHWKSSSELIPGPIRKGPSKYSVAFSPITHTMEANVSLTLRKLQADPSLQKWEQRVVQWPDSVLPMQGPGSGPQSGN